VGRDRADGMERRAGHDAIVIGGGPAGSAAAATLARNGRSVLLVVDRPRSREFGVGEGAPPGLDRVVDEVFGAGTFVAADHLRSLGNRAAWGTAELTCTEFMFSPFGTGWHLDRNAFDAAVLAAATAAGAIVRPVTRIGDGDLKAPVVIDASGRHAGYARRHGGRRMAGDRLTAVLASYARADGDLDATTTVEATESGWWYTCPIPCRRRVVAHLTDGDLLDAALRTSSGFDRRARRTAHIGTLLGRGAPSPPLVVAADTARLDPPCGGGWLAAGDAAASFDPLSSQGILTAVLMGREAGLHCDDPAGYAARYGDIIAAYETERRATYRREQRWPAAPFWARRHPSRGDVIL
jgi:flavin-dependent dehydrogenase